MADDLNPTRDMLEEVAAQFGGQRIQGGCDSCDAYQEIAKDPDHPGIFHLTVYHDPECPLHPTPSPGAS